MTNRIRIGLALGFLLAAAVAWPFVRALYWRSHPEAAFSSVTGHQLPEGVTAAYRAQIEDNLFYVTHYWLLSGEPNSIRAVVGSAPFVRSDDDARAQLPDVARLFGVHTASLVAGYEWDAPRNHWYYVFEGESEALYAY